MKSKDLTIDVTNFYTIRDLRTRNAEIDEVIAVVNQCYVPHYKQITLTYQGSNYLFEKDKVYVQTSIPLFK